jgi:hypothetical protein
LDVFTLLLLVFLVTGASLAVFFYVGASFLQSYIYTEPSQELYWQAPAAAGVLAAFFTLWCLVVANAEGASPRDVPYDTIFRFSPRVDLLKEPARELWAKYQDGQEKRYDRERLSQTRWRYVDTNYTPSRPWQGDGVEGVAVEIDGEKSFFKRVPGSDGSYGEFVNDKGWVMKEYDDGPTGTPSVVRQGRFVATLLLNLAHFLLWWLCLWLLLRFQWSHALGLGFVLWLISTLAFLPMVLTSAAEVAESRATVTRAGQRPADAPDSRRVQMFVTQVRLDGTGNQVAHGSPLGDAATHVPASDVHQGDIALFVT